MIVSERHELALKAAQSTLSLSRINQRLLIIKRFFVALAHRRNTEKKKNKAAQAVTVKEEHTSPAEKKDRSVA